MPDLLDPGLMSDYEVLTHLHTYHGHVPGLATSPEFMTAGVLRRVRDMHDEEHTRTNHHHWHNYLILEDYVAEVLDGVYLRTESDGLDKRTNIWIGNCNKPNCMFCVASYHEQKVRERYEKHSCPQENGPTHYGVSVTISLIEECWIKADRLYEQLQVLDDQTSIAGERLKHELRGMCKILTTFVSPFFPTFQDVAREIAKRYNMREAGQPYETPGTQTRIFDIPQQIAAEATPARRAEKVLDEKERAALKFAIDSGAFTVAELAKVYSISEELVREVGS